mmetsp:Transcript_15569/g.24220  ORF Transcript_15569/g.24220 Transcript_15569/m.24220 type:complete len:246 (+) Transcript_15569:118-855(+)
MQMMVVDKRNAEMVLMTIVAAKLQLQHFHLDLQILLLPRPQLPRFRLDQQHPHLQQQLLLLLLQHPHSLLVVHPLVHQLRLPQQQRRHRQQLQPFPLVVPQLLLPLQRQHQRRQLQQQLQAFLLEHLQQLQHHSPFLHQHLPQVEDSVLLHQVLDLVLLLHLVVVVDLVHLLPHLLLHPLLPMVALVLEPPQLQQLLPQEDSVQLDLELRLPHHHQPPHPEEDLAVVEDSEQQLHPQLLPILLES